jgi:hypothetical protein
VTEKSLPLLGTLLTAPITFPLVAPLDTGAVIEVALSSPHCPRVGCTGRRGSPSGDYVD